MPIKNRDDAVEVNDRVGRIFAAAPSERAGEIRALFVEVLDFHPASGLVGLDPAPGNAALPPSAERVAELDGVHVLYAALDTTQTDRVRKGEVEAAAKLIADQLGDDLLLVFTNTSVSQLHLIQPGFDASRPPLRRMVVERDLPRRTAVQQVSNIYWNHRGGVGIRAALDKAFNVEAVTKAFFEEYKRVFDFAMDRVQGFGSGDDEQEKKRLFVQTLFNRLMFIYFLSRKGWLTFGGDNDYLNALWRGYGSNPEHANFYADRLYHLFFFGLNNPQSRDLNFRDRFMESIFGDVPFLNGGLFEKTELDERGGVTVPDDVIESILSDLFDRFNFTVTESTPYDVEVAVDPEMLGKVFEELVTGRRGTGSYYTPRTVVSFMCREALKGYLEGCGAGLTAEVIARYVDDRDTSGLSPLSARRISDALEEVTVVDPACGSGAYLLGMMQELVDLRTALFNVGVDAHSLYDLKLHVIQRNLYGVDIDEFAVNIAMLRMWLSLSIEYEGDKPKPLPNLDFKVVMGDSLLGPDPSPDNYGDLFHHRARGVAAQLRRLKARHMGATTATDKDARKAEIERVQAELREALADTPAPDGAIDWRVEFAEVFARGGFDVALANPPYIQLQKDGGKLRRLYKDVQYLTFASRGDIYQLFYERGCQLLRPSRGLLAYITSNSWLKAEYGKPLRRYFSEKHEPLALLELGKDVFDSAIVDSCVLLLREGSGSRAFPAVDMDRLPNGDFPPDEGLWGRARPDGEAPWSILSLTEQSVMDKMQARGTPLAEWDVKINLGVLTGYNKAFIIDGATKQALIDSDPSSADIIKPVLRGRDIRRYRAKWAGLWLVVAKFGSYTTLPEEYPAVYKHLVQHEEKLRARGQCRYSRSGRAGSHSDYEGQHHWLELDNNPKDDYLKGFAKEKLFWMDMSPRGRFAYSDAEMYCNDKGFIMTGESPKYLCAVLNSSLITWVMKNMALTTGMGLMQWKRFVVQRLPIPKISAARQRPFVKLVDDILETKAAGPDADTSHLEWEIDKLVYGLYGLTEEEETAIERSLGLIHASDEEEDAALGKWIQEGKTGTYVSKEAVMETLRNPYGG